MQFPKPDADVPLTRMFPHPKAFEIGAKAARKETDEVAVMIDARYPVEIAPLPPASSSWTTSTPENPRAERRRRLAAWLDDHSPSQFCAGRFVAWRATSTQPFPRLTHTFK